MTTPERTGLLGWVLRHWKVVVPVGVALGAVGLWLFFGFFGFHTLFFDEEVNEAPPVFVSGAAPSGMADDALSEEDAAAMNEVMADEGIPAEAKVDEDPMTDDDGAVGTLATGTFVDRSHPTSGTVEILTDGNQTFLRLVDLETDNGPDLNVYLSTGTAGGPTTDFDEDFVDLGDLKGNIGSQNYEVPAGTDVGRYSSVVIWCVRFSVAFGAADLVHSG